MDADNDMGKFLTLSTAEKRAIARKAFYFHISSFGISYVKNLYVRNANSPGNMQNIRCLIEGIAMVHYIEKLSDEEMELFRMQPFVLEHTIYKKYKDLHGVLLDFDLTDNSFKNAKKLYKDLEKLNSEQFKERLWQKIPFAKKDVNYEDVVGEVFGKDFLKFYKMFGIFSHPHDYRVPARTKLYKQLEDIQDVFHELILITLEKMFNKFGNPDILGLEDEYDLLFGGVSFQNFALKRTHEIRELLHKASMATMTNGYTCLAFYLEEVHLFNLDFILDDAYGFVEQGIIKWKQVVEFFAVLDLFADDNHYLQDNDLLHLHTQMALARSMDGKDIDPAWLEEAYVKYLIRFPNGVSKEKFSKVFSKTLGFLIDENGEVPPSLRQLVNGFIDKFVAESEESSFDILDPANREAFDVQHNQDKIKEMIDKGELKKKTVPLDSFLKMCYEESQIMSHATGYMHFANTGAWASGQVLGIYIHKFAERVISKLLKYFQDLRASGAMQSKTLINVLRNYLKRSREHINMIEIVYRIPKIRKTF